tara:strand:+ start:867 stop:1055 length:189 start_codon:yes stop_codon:yes gene_type:complete
MATNVNIHNVDRIEVSKFDSEDVFTSITLDIVTKDWQDKEQTFSVVCFTDAGKSLKDLVVDK